MRGSISVSYKQQAKSCGFNARFCQVKVKEIEKIGVPFYNLRGWIDRKKVGFFPKILFIFLAVKYKLKGLDDYTGPMYDAMLNGGSFYDESGLDPIIEFARSR